MTFAPAPAARNSRRYVLLLLLAYPVLAIAGVVTQQQIFPLLALALLFTALLLPRLFAHRALPWLVWLAGLAGLCLLSWAGWADVVLEAVPVLICAALAYWFGRTLRTREPLVARFILALEGADRLAEPDVRRYARQVTWFWTLLLAGQAVLLMVLLLCAPQDGILMRLGVASPLNLSQRWVSMWLHVGGYAWIAVAFLLEYGYRRWRLRHLVHPSFARMLSQLVLRWPQLLRGGPHDE